ncbi:tRNA uracil 4-sulfurtransferase ThiI [Alicyclobacillus acidocaldarius]|uniref:Probable tRNA sulfurtransferase n=1 Tax=Alicyclobacillus acidocaldarius subsp. acidocaldarius (strain ATCC 27009 / DSM 446 / BCRC 14685 / JCM 5260 / KCTC 1825 / NBRC 15652 / NCIMB 11725 / NRRL B-14509 / 104-IA) TaxID=521098 RepID=C8WW19_ALIAD|nr:tRNA uracil 4-sulfurtransferase ThiI [Alicyclobacillus acidocaldarius]ACV58291.1 thiamine biosynthesis/tRNA modification protein ThiI [Alicyclobacillus acidocaldarius subsp. acidocaldarius DSM 446]
MLYDHLLIRYGELTTKGANRAEMEQLLERNVRRALSQWPDVKVTRSQQRIVVQLNGAPVDATLQKLQQVFGISSISPVAVAPLDLAAIQQTAVEVAKRELMDKSTFKVEARRGFKGFPLDSPALQKAVGASILRALPHIRVDVHRPDVVIEVDIRKSAAYLYPSRVPGLGGFPVGMSGKGLVLLSGGIDSPVAAWKAMKRGLALELVHFHSFPFTSERAQQKVEDLAAILTKWGGPMKLHLVSVTAIQAEIQRSAPEGLRTILLRRMMVRAASRIADEVGAGALVTGDSLGQVASQTLSALNAVDRATDHTILRPLIAEDKLEIIELAKRMGTYDISILPFDDCCSLFAPKHPKTNPKLRDLERAEARMDVEGLIAEAVASREEKLVGADEALGASATYR